MQLNLNYDHNFVELWNKIKTKYPEELLETDGISDNQLDIGEFSKNFMSSDNTANASIDANGNVAHISMATYNKEVFKPLSKLNGYYLMWKEIKKQYDLKTANEAVEKAVNGDIYVHDSTNFSLAYCFNYTAYDIVLAGLPSWTGIAQTRAPKTLKAYTRQVINFLIAAGSQQMGATGIADFLIFFSWFVQRSLEGVYIEEGLDINNFKDRKTFEEAVWRHAKSELTSFIYDINFNYRSDQTLFTNVSLYDNYFLENLLSEIKMPEVPNKIDKNVVMEVQKMYMKIMNEELRRTPLTYPVTTATFTRYNEEEIIVYFEDNTTEKYNQFDKVKVKAGIFENDKNVIDLEVGDIVNGKAITKIKRKVIKENLLRDKKFVETVAKENLEFQFINMFNGESSVLSSCCRLRSNMNDLEKETFGSIGGSGSAKIGSIGVVSINLPRVAFKYKKGEIESVEKEIEKLTELSIKINYARRMLIKDKIERNMLPLYADGFMILNRQFSTTGVLGGFEFSEILGKDITTEEGLEYQINMLKVIRDTQDRLHETCEKYKAVPFNVEQVPAETAAPKLAKKDKILNYNNVGYDLYANQWLPLQKTVNLLDRIRIAGALDNSGHLNGGSILHINADQKLTDYKLMEEMIYNVAKSGVSYWAINFDMVYCKSCKRFDIDEHGKHKCKFCGSTDIERYIRVVGFLTPVKSWSQTKQEADYEKRQFYKEKNVV